MNNFGQIYLGFETHDDRIHAYLLMGHDLISPSSVEQSIIEAIREGITPVIADYSPIPGTKDGDRVLPDHPFDPLLTNKTSWTYRWAPPEKINSLKKLSRSAQSDRFTAHMALNGNHGRKA